MKLYYDLEKNIKKAKETNEQYSVRLDAIKKDLKKRKRGWMARIVILSIWAVILLFSVFMAAGIINLGGSASSAAGSYNEETGEFIPDTNTETEVDDEDDSFFDFSIIAALFVPATWTLCFVGFPIGWNWGKDEREQAKHSLYVQYTVREDGTVDTFQSSLVPKASASIFSILQGCLTMVFSIPIAIVQCFTWKKNIKLIESIVKEIEKNDLFIAA